MSKELNAFLKKNKSITFTLKVKNSAFKCLSFKVKNKNQITDEILANVNGILSATIDANQDLKGVYDFKIMNGEKSDIVNVEIIPNKKVA